MNKKEVVSKYDLCGYIWGNSKIELRFEISNEFPQREEFVGVV